MGAVDVAAGIHRKVDSGGTRVICVTLWSSTGNDLFHCMSVHVHQEMRVFIFNLSIQVERA